MAAMTVGDHWLGQLSARVTGQQGYFDSSGKDEVSGKDSPWRKTSRRRRVLPLGLGTTCHSCLPRLPATR